MIKLFFYNSNDKLSVEAYNFIKSNDMDVECIEITGKNVACRVKRLGITQVPTLYIKSRGNIRMLIGTDIISFFDMQTQSDDEMSGDLSIEEDFDKKIAAARSENPTRGFSEPKKQVRFQEDEASSDVQSEEKFNGGSDKKISADKMLENEKIDEN